MVNYTEAFEKPFTDIKKLLVGILLSIIPAINWFAVGFEMKCSGVGKIKPSKKMPDWKNFGDLLLKGFFNFLIALIYMIPAAIILVLSAGAVLLNILIQVPWGQVSKVSSEEASALINPIIQAAIPSLTAALPFIILAGVLLLLAIYAVPIAVLSYLENEKFAEAFNLKKVFKKAFTGKYLLAWLAMTLLGFILGSILGFIPFIGTAAASFIVGVIGFSLFGQIYLETGNAKNLKKAKK